MATCSVEPDTTLSWQHVPASPVAPGGGRASEGHRLRAGLTSHELAAWSEFVAEHTGLYFPTERVHALQSGLARRRAALGLRSLANYRMLLDAVPSEWFELASELTVGETRLFRQPEVFAALTGEILPEIIERKQRARDRSLRAWSAGCSTGEEAYSLSIVMDETLHAPWLWDVNVRGTDLNRNAISHARTGLYDAVRLNAVAEDRTTKYFRLSGAGCRRKVDQRLWDITNFQVHNLTGTAWPLYQFDLIVCQNVLMYLLPELRLPVICRLYRSLRPGGYLIIGPSELPVEALPGGIRPVNVAGILVYRRS